MEHANDAETLPTPPPTSADDGLTEEASHFAFPEPKELDKAEILRQVEHYFSDENLQRDAHMLGKLEEGNGTVSVKHILGFPRMRKYKPPSAVREILKASTFIQVIDNKRIRRFQPFDMATAKVKAKTNEGGEAAKRKAALEANPHLTKAMLKRTGFEHDHVEPELSLEEQQEEVEQYSTEHPIYERLETAVLRFKMNRKLHQETLRVFHAYLEFGGFEQRAPMFTGGMSKEDEESLTKEEKARRKQLNFVSSDVVQSVTERDGKWFVDFEGVTNAFFSTTFPDLFYWHDDIRHDKEVTSAACNVLRNFLNYLLYHKVCTEYTEQIHAAKEALETIESEYVDVAAVQRVFPGAFSVACSTLFRGHYAKASYHGDWMTPKGAAEAKKGFSGPEATAIVNAGIAAFASLEQIEDIMSRAELRINDTEDNVGLEVIEIVPVRHSPIEAQELFSKLEKTVVPPMGKLICKRYNFPKAAPLDLPPDLPPGANEFVFLMDEKSLQKCYLGLKFVATVKEMSVGLWFIDHWSECYGTYYTWCWNERARGLKEYSKPLQKFGTPDQTSGDPITKEERLLKDGPAMNECHTSLGAVKSDSTELCSTTKDNYGSDDNNTHGESNVKPMKQSNTNDYDVECTLQSSTSGDAARVLPLRGRPVNPASDGETTQDASGDDSFFSDEESDCDAE